MSAGVEGWFVWFVILLDDTGSYRELVEVSWMRLFRCVRSMNIHDVRYISRSSLLCVLALEKSRTSASLWIHSLDFPEVAMMILLSHLDSD